MPSIEELAEDTQDTEEKLTALVEHRTWVWGRISGADQAVLAQRITNTLLKRMSELSLATDDHIKGLVVYSETVLWKVDRLQESFDSLARAILAKYERSESDLRTIIGDREKEVAALRTALEAAQRAADAGNNDAELAIRVARATGDAELLQKTIAHIAREERKRYLQRRQQEDSVYVTRAREVVAISYLRQDFDEALLWLQEILAVSPDDLDATYRIAIIHLVRGDLTTSGNPIACCNLPPMMSGVRKLFSTLA